MIVQFVFFHVSMPKTGKLGDLSSQPIAEGEHVERILKNLQVENRTPLLLRLALTGADRLQP